MNVVNKNYGRESEADNFDLWRALESPCGGKMGEAGLVKNIFTRVFVVKNVYSPKVGP